MSDTVRILLKGQACLYASVIICVMLAPEGLASNKGISYFSGRLLTIIPYSAGLLITAWYFLKYAQSLPTDTAKDIKLGTRMIVALTVLVVLVPYGFNETLELVHRYFSGFLFILQFLFVFWVGVIRRPGLISSLLFIILTIVGFMILTFFSIEMRLLILGELIFQALFATVLYWLAIVTHKNYESI